MGYYKQLQIAQQTDVDRLAAWWKANSSKMPRYMYDWVMERDERLWPLIEAWENAPAEPVRKPASSHVALQPEPRKLRRLREKAPKTYTVTKSEYVFLITAVLVEAAIAIGLLLYISAGV